jgi:hypothetical protein
MASIGARGFVTVSDIAEKDGSIASTVGGRVDVRKTFEDINFVLSLTDATAKDVENAPWLQDALLTADKKISGEILSFWLSVWAR